MIHCVSITKTYGRGEQAQTVLAQVDLTVGVGECCLLMGPSGSGKTTLLSILGCLLSPTAGRLDLAGESVDFSDPAHLQDRRRRSIGFVFQHAQLLPFLSARDNVELVARNAGLEPDAAVRRADELLDRVGLSPHAGRKPGELSGGQRQRAAIARALVGSPRVLLADEPTAALDWTSGQSVVELLTRTARDAGAALVTVTHDHRLEKWFDRVVEIDNGRLVYAETRSGDIPVAAR